MSTEDELLRTSIMPEPEGSETDRAYDTIQRALAAVRSHLGMDAAYVSEFVGDRTVFRVVDAPGNEARLPVGASMSLSDVYCRHILEGRLPELMPDTSKVPMTEDIPITKGIPVGAHMSVPIKLQDGRIFGMFCCLSQEPDPSLNKRDLNMMRAFADVTAIQIGRDLEEQHQRAQTAKRIQEVLDADGLTIVYQPIMRLADDRVVGFECLSRFQSATPRSPDQWFAEAAAAGIGRELEIAAIQQAVAPLKLFDGDSFLAVNVSAETVLSGGLSEALRGVQLQRVVVELTEHTAVSDYQALQNVLKPLRKKGLKIALDDAGAGYSGLRHMIDLKPDYIKLDISITRNIDTDAARRAMAAAIATFSRQTGSSIVAEGVETKAELDVLRRLGVEKAQGYLISRPVTTEQAIAIAHDPSSIKVAKAA